MWFTEIAIPSPTPLDASFARRRSLIVQNPLSDDTLILNSQRGLTLVSVSLRMMRALLRIPVCLFWVRFRPINRLDSLFPLFL